MRILVITQENSGVGYHRLMLPIYYLKKEYAHFTDTFTEEILNENFDLVVFNRFIPNTPIDELLRLKEKYGFKIIIDIDDYWFLDSWHILYMVYPSQVIIDHIRIADLVTTTNELLYNEIIELNKNVHILPNALPFGEDQFIDTRNESELVRYVYTGSITHEKDLKILQYPLKKVASDVPLKQKVHFQLCGYNDEADGSAAIWHRMISNFTCGLKLGSVKRHLPVTQYINFYFESDVSLVPLFHSRFNAMKSNLKVLEAACKKIPVIVSNVEPYSKCPYAIKINSQPDWYKEIKKTATDAIYRSDLGQANYEWCNENFNLYKINIERKQLYESLCQ